MIEGTLNANGLGAVLTVIGVMQLLTLAMVAILLWAIVNRK